VFFNWFNVFILKIIFKNKKYYFDIFSNKKHLKNNFYCTHKPSETFPYNNNKKKKKKKKTLN